MTKIEQKLVELGYIKHKMPFTEGCYKFQKRYWDVELVIKASELSVISSYMICTYHIARQDHIERLQSAFNVLQNDLEELDNVKD